MTRHFLTVEDLTPYELVALLDDADARKAARHAGRPADTPLAGRTVAMIFEKPSTRTRVSFQVAVTELGGQPLALSAGDLQLGRGETVADTARVLSRYVHALVVRTFAQQRLVELATHGTVPVVNALSDAAHPCQALADLQTVRERLGRLGGVTLAYLGDGNNVTHSLLRAGAMTGMHVRAVCPPGYEPDADVVAAAAARAAETGGSVAVTGDVAAGIADADVLYTDVWTSMGQEDDAARVQALEPYRLDAAALAQTAEGAIVLHCLPAHRGEEIAVDVIDGPSSAVWDQAENRLHAQKALLVTLLAEPGAA